MCAYVRKKTTNKNISLVVSQPTSVYFSFSVSLSVCLFVLCLCQCICLSVCQPVCQCLSALQKGIFHSSSAAKTRLEISFFPPSCSGRWLPALCRPTSYVWFIVSLQGVLPGHTEPVNCDSPVTGWSVTEPCCCTA